MHIYKPLHSNTQTCVHRHILAQFTQITDAHAHACM